MVEVGPAISMPIRNVDRTSFVAPANIKEIPTKDYSSLQPLFAALPAGGASAKTRERPSE